MFSENLKAIMLEKGINQKELAAMMGMSESTISLYLNEKSTPKIKTVHKLAKVLGVTVEFLIGETVLHPENKRKMTIAEAAKRCSKSRQFIQSGLKRRAVRLVIPNLKTTEV